MTLPFSFGVVPNASWARLQARVAKRGDAHSFPCILLHPHTPPDLTEKEIATLSKVLGYCAWRLGELKEPKDNNPLCSTAHCNPFVGPEKPLSRRLEALGAMIDFVDENPSLNNEPESSLEAKYEEPAEPPVLSSQNSESFPKTHENESVSNPHKEAELETYELPPKPSLDAAKLEEVLQWIETALRASPSSVAAFRKALLGSSVEEAVEVFKDFMPSERRLIVKRLRD